MKFKMLLSKIHKQIFQTDTPNETNWTHLGVESLAQDLCSLPKVLCSIPSPDLPPHVWVMGRDGNGAGRVKVQADPNPTRLTLLLSHT